MLDGKELTMGVSGKLWKNVLIIYDRQTKTLWSHLTGGGVFGPLKGKRLKTFHSAFMTFSEWTKLNPDTKVLQKKGGIFGLTRSSSRDPYEGYYYSRQTGIIPQKYRDNRLHPKTFIVGLVLDDAAGKRIAKAYPFDALNKAGVVNDTFAGRDLVVSYCHGARSGVIFDRNLDGKKLSFEAKGVSQKGGKECLLMKDSETGSTWQGLTGVSLDGPLKGKRLTPVQSTHAFWFGWKDYYPKSEIYKNVN